MIPVLIISFTVISVFFLDRWENKHIKAIFNWVPAILLAYLIPAAISMLIGEDFAAADIHRFSKTYFIPFAIIAVMSSLSINQLKSIGWKPIAVFVIGSFWIAVFPIMLAFVLLDTSFVANLLIHQEYWKGLPPIVGSWIGGSTSQLVLKELVECPENIFLTVLVIDNVLVNIWTILMFQGIKKTDSLNRFFKISNIAMPENIEEQKGEKIHPVFIFLVLLSSILLVNNFIESFIIKVIAVSIIGLLFSNLIKKWNINFALRIGSILILLVMAILGLKLKFSAMEFDIAFLGFLVVWLISHVVIMLIAAKLLNVSIAWVPIASMANVGGIATAPAVTAAYEKKWMPHAILLAILSMATGTLWGLLTIFLFKTFLL
ncbi:DUF819 family protein [Flavobacteriaceae bacterium]|jgi:uncharacterized membrane protein|nr:DUF819 family protein [Flavobacteriaceae bacterium]MDB4226191.1 DUF819 family protein [Flavobacteriaceae bacterium]MDB9893195.1 DUF819 family protein [Flavobacteriaceae bacterium]MDB9927047.1 DUF819 family protein [Flavobacteriaceae bacterium]MDC1342953.1 DUF819 family protein [Flavobacteriaceae bacterium]|tara:strand:- start:287 stop:1411 length:1125 start_codon:yes stop_codon:yes gene_type:complete